MNPNVIAIVAISFISVGLIWAVGNLIYSPQLKLKPVKGNLLIAQNNVFNGTNPTIFGVASAPTRLVVLNKDFVKHDFIVDGLGINTSYLSSDQDFVTAIASKKPGTFEYYCSLHPSTMRGKIIIKEHA